jgi:hypothetical protein
MPLRFAPTPLPPNPIHSGQRVIDGFGGSNSGGAGICGSRGRRNRVEGRATRGGGTGSLGDGAGGPALLLGLGELHRPLGGGNAAKLDLLGVEGVARGEFEDDAGVVVVGLADAEGFEGTAEGFGDLRSRPSRPRQINHQPRRLRHQLRLGLHVTFRLKFQSIRLRIEPPRRQLPRPHRCDQTKRTSHHQTRC